MKLAGGQILFVLSPCDRELEHSGSVHQNSFTHSNRSLIPDCPDNDDDSVCVNYKTYYGHK